MDSEEGERTVADVEGEEVGDGGDLEDGGGGDWEGGEEVRGIFRRGGRGAEDFRFGIVVL